MVSRKPERSIGLLGASATLIGYVVGASIFILPGELAPSTGPAVFVSYLLASVPALLSCFVTAQIGSVYPVSGAA
jgi:APA family basic amino acid/polyamine antiporter